ncbi:MAG: SpaH/EbpB family LPXTG-anchored major pilin [Oscillospiraceae bacterium]|nr:SpaH/EbpB family LPXTG-anchored major pilin [Oscillospiraceae bacterium]
MNNVKKILALVLVAVMMMALSVSAFAATITVTQSPTGGTAGNESYVAYKIFDVTKTSSVTESVTTDDTLGPGTAKGFAYSIDADSAWVSVLTSTTGKTYFTLTPSADGKIYTVALVDGNNTEAKAKEIAAWLLANIPTTLATVDKKYEFETDNMAVTVDDGYYLITSSLGTNLILATSNINITEKNQYIVDNKVAETASMTIGQSATYYIEVFLPSTIDVELPVVVHDTLATALKFNNDVQVAVLDTDPGSTAADYKTITTYGTLPTAFVVGNGDEAENPCTFHITLGTNEYAGKYLVFKYTAELTSAADPDGDGYVNKEYTTYSNYETTPSTPVVKTYDFDFTKVDGDGAKLDGAEFELYAAWDDTNNKPSGDPIALIADGNNYKKADTDDSTTVTTITVNSKTTDAATKISGLGGADNTTGTNYYLVETKAPTGFNMLTAPIIVNVKDDGTITISLDGKTLSSANDAFDVVNQSGSVLPSTGGIGTTIFYIVGALLVVGAGVVLVTRRKVDADK